MLLTIHNLPAATRYADIKSLLQSKCGLQQVILDNLVGEGTGKKVTVGVAEDADAAILVRKINGLYWNGQQLYVEDVRRQKNASEQPYRSIPQEEQSFRSMNLQEHSSFPQGVPMPSEMMPSVQPLMAAMYYTPDYTNQDYIMQNVGGVQANFKQNFDQVQNVQNAYMEVGNIPQTRQMPQAGMSQYNQDFSSSVAQNQSLPWEEAYNEAPNSADRPSYGQPSNKRKADWAPSRRESPPRNDRVQPWSGGNDTRARPLPDFRPNFRPDDRTGFNKPRPDFRPNDRPSLLPNPAQSTFEAIDQGRPSRFTGPQEFPKIPNKRQRMDERSDEFARSNERRGPNEFERPNSRRGQNEFSRGPNEFSGGQNARREPNEFSGGQNEFSGRPNDRHGPNEFSGRQNERRGPNEFSGRPNEFSGGPNARRGPNNFSGGMNERGKPNDFSGRSNDHSGGQNTRRAPNNFSGEMNERSKPNDFSGRSNDRRGPNQFSERPNQRRGPNEFSGGPNEHQRRPNEHQSRPNERNGRPNERPGFSKPNREFDRPYQLPTRNRPDRDRVEGPRKRKFEQTIEEVQRPKRVSRPKPKQTFEKQLESTMDDAAKARISKKMFMNGVRKIVYQISTNLGMRETDLDTRQMFRQLIIERLESIIDGRTMIPPLEVYELYRSMYPEMGDKTTYDTILAMVSKKNETVGVKEGVVPKPVAKPVAKPLAKPVAKPVAKPAAKPVAKPSPAPLPKKMTKSEILAIKMRKEAQDLLAQGKLPSFPQGDKRQVAQQRKEEKEGYIPEVEPKYKVAIDEELDKIGNVFIHGLNNAPTPDQQRACDTVNKTLLVDDIKLILLQNLSRRVSNTGLKIVRVFGYPKLPTRAVLEKAVMKLGVLSLRKSQKSKMYAASVDTYDNLDKLCKMEHLDVGGGIFISFKPFHLAIKERADQKMLHTMRKQIIKDMIDTTDLNLLDKDWPAKEAEIKAKQEAEAAAKAALEAEAKAAKEAAKTTEVEDEETAKLQEKETLDEVPKDGETTANDSKNASDYLNDDFHVIDEVNETDSDVEFTGDVAEAFDLNNDDENDGNVDESNGTVDESGGNVDESAGNVDESAGNVDESGGNVDESAGNDDNNDNEGTELEDGDDNDFDIDNVDVSIDDLNEDDLEDY